MRLLVYLTWLTPLAAAALAFSGDTRIVMFAACCSITLTYAGWCRVEAWLGGRGVWWRALGPTLATIVFVAWAGCVVGLLVGFAAAML